MGRSTYLHDRIGEEVVVDVSSPYIFLGTLVGEDDKYLVLANADVHDLRDTTNTTRERYIVDSKLHGIKANRQRVLISQAEIVSISTFDEVIC